VLWTISSRIKRDATAKWGICLSKGGRVEGSRKGLGNYKTDLVFGKFRRGGHQGPGVTTQKRHMLPGAGMGARGPERRRSVLGCLLLVAAQEKNTPKEKKKKKEEGCYRPELREAKGVGVMVGVLTSPEAIELNVIAIV